MKPLQVSPTIWLQSRLASNTNLKLYAVTNGMSVAKALQIFYQEDCVINAKAFFDHTPWASAVEEGPWLCELSFVCVTQPLSQHEDWGLLLLNTHTFYDLYFALKNYLYAYIADEAFMVRWWDPRILYHLSSALETEDLLLNTMSNIVLMQQENWYYLECSNKTVMIESTFNQPWRLNPSAFDAYRSSSFYAKQLAFSLSENLLRFDQKQWLRLTKEYGSIRETLVDIICQLQKNHIAAHDIEHQCIAILNHQVTLEQVIDHKNMQQATIKKAV